MEKMEIRRIKFRGEDYLLIGPPDLKEGSIATEDEYKNGRCSFAQLIEDGRIMQFGRKIGTADEIEFGDEVYIRENEGAFENLANHPSWDLEELIGE